MNSKLIKASLAGAAALAVATGGGTFAAWSDFGTSSDRSTGAGQLTLALGAETTQVVGATDRLNLKPGGNSVRDFFIASNSGDSVPTGNLYVTPQIVSDNEDGCTSSNSEAAAQAVEYPGTSCASTANPGQFSDQVNLEIYQSAPFAATSAPDCSTQSYPTHVLPAGKTLLERDGQRYQIANGLQPGQGICVRFLYVLPAGATNAIQGDSTDHNAKFDLVQCTPVTTPSATCSEV
jgi:hypothetical protein